MNSGIPRSHAEGDGTYVTAFCFSSYHLCELCGSRHALVVVRATPYGPACMDLCPSCRGLAEPILVRTPTAALEHREHLARAADVADPRRGS